MAASTSAAPSSAAPFLPKPRLFYGWIVMIACLMITMASSGTMMAFGVFINPMAIIRQAIITIQPSRSIGAGVGSRCCRSWVLGL